MSQYGDVLEGSMNRAMKAATRNKGRNGGQQRRKAYHRTSIRDALLEVIHLQ